MKDIYQGCQAGCICLLILIFWSADSYWLESFALIGPWIRGLKAVFHDPEVQWWLIIFCDIYLAAFFFIRWHRDDWILKMRNGTQPFCWLILCLIVSEAVCIVGNNPSAQALIMLGGPMAGQGFGLWANMGRPQQGLQTTIKNCQSDGNAKLQLIVICIIFMVVFVSVWQPNIGVFQYRNHARWSGFLNHPNSFGLLMGTGLALAIGGVAGFSGQGPGHAAGSRKQHAGWLFLVVVCLLAVGLMAQGLWHSYSRGAWLATVAGLIFLRRHRSYREPVESHGYHAVRGNPAERPRLATNRACASGISWFHPHRLPTGIILISLMTLLFWHFRQTDWHPARRALSVVNSADFSSRNRVAAWVGDLQMMAEHPWFGVGWNQAEPLYEHYYMPPRLTESAAIEMNDYLMLGATLGVPALFGFAMYLGLSLMQNEKLKITNAAEENADGAQSCVAAEVTRLKLKPDNRNEIADNTADADRQCSDCNSQKPPPGAILDPRFASVESAPLAVGIPSYNQSLIMSAATGTGADIRHSPSSDFLATTCRAGAIVLLVGFWFDGGLFKLPMAATFWILLELGNVQAQTNPNERAAKK